MVVDTRARNFEEDEILNSPPPIISREDFLIKEEFFVKNDLLPKPKSRRVIDRVP